MKKKLTEDHQSALLTRSISEKSLQMPGNRQEQYGGAAARGRRLLILRDGALGVFMGAPLGAAFYYVSLVIYYPVLIIIGLLTSMTPWMSQAAKDAAQYQVEFGPVCAILLSALCIALDIFCTRRAIEQGQKSFALAQAPLSIITILALFLITMIKHKPLLPFYGQ